MAIPIAAFFVGINGFVALLLSYVVVMERTRTRIWHGECEADITAQPDYLKQPNGWAALVERLTQRLIGTTVSEDGMLQRKVCAYRNFTEYVPLALLFIVVLELINAAPWLLWLMGWSLTLGRIAHAWGLIKTYGPSPGRAIGFFLTWFVYGVGAGGCLYYSLPELFN